MPEAITANQAVTGTAGQSTATGIDPATLGTLLLWMGAWAWLGMQAAGFFVDRIGDTFRAVVSGVKDGMVWCRIGNPPCEGKLDGLRKARVGQKLQVELTSVNVERGWIDFDAIH